MLAACSSGSGDDARPDAASTAVVDAGALEKPAAQLEALKGTVTVTHASVTGPGQSGPLFEGDIVETLEKSSAVLAFADGRRVELGENGRLEIDVQGDGLVLNVGQGLVVSRVGESGGDGSVALSFETPYGLVRAGAGGLSIAVGKDGAAVDVLTGAITIVGREGSALNLGTGEGGTLNATGATRRVLLEPLTVVLTQGSGRIELKRKDGKTFAVVNPRKAPALAPGDTLRVTQGSATLTPDKSDARVTLLAGTEVGIGESNRSGGAEDVALDVRKGQLQLALPFGKKRTIRPGDGVTLVAEQGGQLSVVRGKNGLELNSVVGDVLVTTESGQSVTVKGGQNASIGKTAIETRDIGKEALTIASRQGQRLVHPGAERVSLVWPGDDSKAYRFKLGGDPSLDKPTVDGVLHQTFFNTLAPARGALYWRVYDGENEVAKGSVSFAPEKLSDELGGITNEVPAGPDKTVIYFQDKPPALTFTWKTPDKPVAEYQLKVYRAGSLASPVQERQVAATSVQLPHGALGEGAYQWDVTWLDAKGTAIGTAGKMNQLELHYDNAVRALIIKSPRNGDPLTPKVTVSGIAPLGTRVSVNGQLMTLDAKARFLGQVAPLAGGRVVFRMAGGDGGETVIVRWLGRGGAR